MHNIHLQLTDKLYQEAMARADQAGFANVDEYVADLVTEELAEDTDNCDHLFTPERLAHINAVLADVNAGGKTYTMEEVNEHFRKRFES